MIYTPEGTELLKQLSDDEKTRVEVVVNAVREFSPSDEQRPVFIGGRLNRATISHHILLAVDIPDTEAPTLLRHIRNALDHSQLPSVLDESISTIAQPYFLGRSEQSTSGKPIYAAVGREQLQLNVNEIQGRLV